MTTQKRKRKEFRNAVPTYYTKLLPTFTLVVMGIIISSWIVLPSVAILITCSAGSFFLGVIIMDSIFQEMFYRKELLFTQPVRDEIDDTS